MSAVAFGLLLCAVNVCVNVSADAPLLSTLSLSASVQQLACINNSTIVSVSLLNCYKNPGQNFELFYSSHRTRSVCVCSCQQLLCMVCVSTLAGVLQQQT
jgi:hypothetical protein